MSEEFKPIETQEQLNAVIGDRLRRSEEQVKKQYEGYLSPEEVANQTKDLTAQLNTANHDLEEAREKIKTHADELAERDLKIKGFEVNALKHKAAQEAGLPYGAVDFLKGDDEESIKASAEGFKALMSKNHSAPEVSGEPVVDSSKAAMKKMVNNLVKEK